MKEVKHDDKWEDEGVKDNPVDAPEPSEALDAMSPEIAPGLALIEQLRIYDVLFGIYRHLDQDKADALYEIHAQGRILGPLPFIEGEN